MVTSTALPPWHRPLRTHASCPKPPSKPRERWPGPLGTALAATHSRAGVRAAQQPPSCPAAFWCWQSWDSTGRSGAAGRWLLRAGNPVPGPGEAAEEQKQLQDLKAGPSRPDMARVHCTQVAGAAQPVPEEAASDSLTAAFVTNAGIRQEPEQRQSSPSSKSQGSPKDTSHPGPETRRSQQGHGDAELRTRAVPRSCLKLRSPRCWLKAESQPQPCRGAPGCPTQLQLLVAAGPNPPGAPEDTTLPVPTRRPWSSPAALLHSAAPGVTLSQPCRMSVSTSEAQTLIVIPAPRESPPLLPSRLRTSPAPLCSLALIRNKRETPPGRDVAAGQSPAHASPSFPAGPPHCPRDSRSGRGCRAARHQPHPRVQPCSPTSRAAPRAAWCMRRQRFNSRLAPETLRLLPSHTRSHTLADFLPAPPAAERAQAPAAPLQHPAASGEGGERRRGPAADRGTQLRGDALSVGCDSSRSCC